MRTNGVSIQQIDDQLRAEGLSTLEN